MTDTISRNCPDCEQAQLLDTGDGTLVCPDCGERFTATTRRCPYCTADNDLDAKACHHCGRALRRVCPRCQTMNPLKADQCCACGQALDTLGHIAVREELRFADRFTRMAEGVGSVKATEQAHSQQRLDQMWEVERLRRAVVDSEQQRQRRQELGMIYAALIMLVLIIGGLIVIALVTRGG